MHTRQVFAGIEAGGTKFVCALGNGPDEILDERRFPTTTPDETLGQVVEFFRPHAAARQLRAVGVGSFGPIDARRDSPTYGFITSTPKPGWQDLDVAGRIESALQLPVAFDTDVNAAALGEFRWGAGRGCDPCLYVTIGTGIGGGYIVEGKPLQGLSNTEMGHIRIRHDLERDPFPGSCPFHGDCLEGLASGPAIRSRFAEDPGVLPDEDPFWDLEAQYIATGLVNCVLVLSPRRIILGGGVMQRSFLFPRVRAQVLDLLNDYVRSPDLTQRIDGYIVPPALGGRSGVLGAIALAQML
jgi:fructokinase